MITGAYVDHAADARWAAEAERINQRARINAEVKSYFEALGYSVGWDFNHREGYWHEIYHPQHGLVCQIDQNVPLAHIVQDMTVMASGAETGTSPSDYTISGPNSQPMQELLRRVTANQMGGVQENLPV